MVDERFVVRASEILRLLGNPVRVALMLELDAHGERCVHELVDVLGVSQPLVSQHLRVLRTARLVDGRRAGREVRYSITDEHVTRIVLAAIHHAQEEQR